MKKDKAILAKERFTTHGNCKVGSVTPEYRCWSHIKSRCYNKNVNEYKLYGGRGIVVCDKWLYSFENFLSDMGLRPSKYHSIERINVNGNYEPSNCRWATQKEQQRNRRNNTTLSLNGENKTIAEWTELYGLKRCTISFRIRKGWNVEKAITTPTLKLKRLNKEYYE